MLKSFFKPRPALFKLETAGTKRPLKTLTSQPIMTRNPQHSYRLGEKKNCGDSDSVILRSLGFDKMH